MMRLLLLLTVTICTVSSQKPEDNTSGDEAPPVRYTGPVVYSNLPPPVLYFPTFPEKPDTRKMNEQSNMRDQPRPIEYIPLPYHNLPVLIYQSRNHPPIHVVHKQQQLPSPMSVQMRGKEVSDASDEMRKFGKEKMQQENTYPMMHMRPEMNSQMSVKMQGEERKKQSNEESYSTMHMRPEMYNSMPQNAPSQMQNEEQGKQSPGEPYSMMQMKPDMYREMTQNDRNNMQGEEEEKQPQNMPYAVMQVRPRTYNPNEAPGAGHHQYITVGLMRQRDTGDDSKEQKINDFRSQRIVSIGIGTLSDIRKQYQQSSEMPSDEKKQRMNEDMLNEKSNSNNAEGNSYRMMRGMTSKEENEDSSERDESSQKSHGEDNPRYQHVVIHIPRNLNDGPSYVEVGNKEGKDSYQGTVQGTNYIGAARALMKNRELRPNEEKIADPPQSWKLNDRYETRAKMERARKRPTIENSRGSEENYYRGYSTQKSCMNGMNCEPSTSPKERTLPRFSPNMRYPPRNIASEKYSPQMSGRNFARSIPPIELPLSFARPVPQNINMHSMASSIIPHPLPLRNPFLPRYPMSNLEEFPFSTASIQDPYLGSDSLQYSAIHPSFPSFANIPGFFNQPEYHETSPSVMQPVFMQLHETDLKKRNRGRKQESAPNSIQDKINGNYSGGYAENSEDKPEVPHIVYTGHPPIHVFQHPIIVKESTSPYSENSYDSSSETVDQKQYYSGKSRDQEPEKPKPHTSASDADKYSSFFSSFATIPEASQSNNFHYAGEQNQLKQAFFMPAYTYDQAGIPVNQNIAMISPYHQSFVPSHTGNENKFKRYRGIVDKLSALRNTLINQQNQAKNLPLYRQYMQVLTQLGKTKSPYLNFPHNMEYAYSDQPHPQESSIQVSYMSPKNSEPMKTNVRRPPIIIYKGLYPPVHVYGDKSSIEKDTEKDMTTSESSPLFHARSQINNGPFYDMNREYAPAMSLISRADVSTDDSEGGPNNILDVLTGIHEKQDIQYATAKAEEISTDKHSSQKNGLSSSSSSKILKPVNLREVSSTSAWKPIDSSITKKAVDENKSHLTTEKEVEVKDADKVETTKTKIIKENVSGTTASATSQDEEVPVETRSKLTESA